MQSRYQSFGTIVSAAVVALTPAAWAQERPALGPLSQRALTPGAAIVVNLPPSTNNPPARALVLASDRQPARQESANIDLQWRGTRLVDQVFANDVLRPETGESNPEAHRISQLTWAAEFPAVAIDVLDPSTNLTGGAGLEFWIGGSPLGLGTSQAMEDLDWLVYGTDNDLQYPDYSDAQGYSFRTLSPNTSLDWAGGLNFHTQSSANPRAQSPRRHLRTGLGLQLNAQQWTARGAKGAYSDMELFDTPVDLPNDTLAVRLGYGSLSPYFSAGFLWQQGPIRLDIDTRAGLAATFTGDRHEQRDLDIQSLGVGWHLGIETRVAVALNDQADFHLGGEFQRTTSYGLWRRNHWHIGSSEYPAGRTVQWLRWLPNSSHIDTHAHDWSISMGLSFKF